MICPSSITLQKNISQLEVCLLDLKDYFKINMFKIANENNMEEKRARAIPSDFIRAVARPPPTGRCTF